MPRRAASVASKKSKGSKRSRRSKGSKKAKAGAAAALDADRRRVGELSLGHRLLSSEVAHASAWVRERKAAVERELREAGAAGLDMPGLAALADGGMQVVGHGFDGTAWEGDRLALTAKGAMSADPLFTSGLREPREAWVPGAGAQGRPSNS